MTETRATYEVGRLPAHTPLRTIDPAVLRRVLAHDFRDALDTLTGDVPTQPEDYTTSTVSALLRDLRLCESYLLMLRHQAGLIERCDWDALVLDALGADRP